LKYNWAKESEKWLRTFSNKRDIHVLESQNDDFSRKKIVIASYDMAKQPRTLKKLYHGRKKFNVVICDECHNMKNPESNRSKRLTPLIKRAKRVIMMSGTPATNRPVELFNTLHCIRPDLFLNHKDFSKMFCQSVQMDFVGRRESYEGCRDPRALNRILKTYMIRRLKIEVLPQLPQKVRTKMLLDIDTRNVSNINANLRTLENLGVNVEAWIEQRLAANRGGGQEQEAGVFNRWLTENELNHVRNLFADIYRESGLAKVQPVFNHIKELLVYP
jgi:SNF2 family DNA or RNA helicase